MKTLTIYYCQSHRSFANYPLDYTYEIDRNGILRVSFISRREQYESQEIAVYRNWDYFQIEEMD